MEDLYATGGTLSGGVSGLSDAHGYSVGHEQRLAQLGKRLMSFIDHGLIGGEEASPSA